jgi:hypothetical protein
MTSSMDSRGGAAAQIRYSVVEQGRREGESRVVAALGKCGGDGAIPGTGGSRVVLQRPVASARPP